MSETFSEGDLVEAVKGDTLIRARIGTGRDYLYISDLGALDYIIGRGYMATRCLEGNAVCACSGCHVYYTHHPIEWIEWSHEWLGFTRFEELWALAKTHITPDWAQVLERLQQRAKELDL